LIRMPVKHAVEPPVVEFHSTARDLQTGPSSKPTVARTLLFAVVLLAWLAPGSGITPETPYGPNDPNLGGIYLVWRGSLYLTVFVAALVARRGRPFWSVIEWFLPFVCWATLSAICNGGSVPELRTLVSLIVTIVYLATATQVFSFPEDLEPLLRVCVAALVCSVAYGIACRFVGSPVYLRGLWGPTSLWGTWVNTNNELAMYSDIVVTAIILLGGHVRTRRPLLSGALGAAVLCMAFLIGMRGPLIALGFAVLTTLRNVSYRRLTAVVIGVVCGCAGGVLLMRGYLTQRSIAPAGQGIFGVSTSGRSEVWPLYWRYGMSAPFIGHGPNADMAYARTIGLITVPNAHDDYLALFIAFGVVGLSLYAVAMALCYRRLRGRRAQLRQVVSPRVAAGAFAFIAVLALTDTIVRSPPAMFPLFALVGCGLSGAFRHPHTRHIHAILVRGPRRGVLQMM
jgi:hypothetical protein